MKRFMIILWSSLLIAHLSPAQNVPVTIVGDVYVASAGSIRSDGPVHIKVSDPGGANQRTGIVDNMGTVALYDSLIFYSYDAVDGLLRNLNTVTLSGIGANKKVVVRKAFTDNNWHSIAMPFDVNLTSGVRLFKNGVAEPAVYSQDGSGASDNFWVRYYDTYKRAYTGKNDFSNWVYYSALGTYDGSDGSSSPLRGKYTTNSGNTLRAGTAFLVGIDCLTGPTTDVALEFSAVDDNAITTLLTMNDKSVALDYPTMPDSRKHLFVTDEIENSEGWNIFGGLNSSSFLLGKTGGGIVTSDYDRLIYYNKVINPLYNSGAWGNVLITVDDASQYVTLSPYTPIYVKNADASTANFTFKVNGLSIAPPNPAGFRSLEAGTRDYLSLGLVDQANQRERVLLKLENGLSKFYDAAKDGVAMLNLNIPVPQMWIVGEMNSGRPIDLALNGIPTGPNEVKLGISVPAGTFTFDLREIRNNTVRSAVLLDKATGAQTDLLVKPYTFTSSSGQQTTDRFTLFINKTVTGLDELTGVTEIYAYVNNNSLTVKNVCNGDRVQVVDMAGRTVVSGLVSGNEFSATLNQKGVYLVNVKGEKVAVLKVLNK
jgi:hypothetical protein